MDDQARQSQPFNWVYGTAAEEPVGWTTVPDEAAGLDLEEGLQQLGYQAVPSLTVGGDYNGFTFSVHREARRGTVTHPYAVVLTLGSTAETILVSRLPALIELLAKLAPVATGADYCAQLRHAVETEAEPAKPPMRRRRRSS